MMIATAWRRWGHISLHPRFVRSVQPSPFQNLALGATDVVWTVLSVIQKNDCFREINAFDVDSHTFGKHPQSAVLELDRTLHAITKLPQRRWFMSYHQQTSTRYIHYFRISFSILWYSFLWTAWAPRISISHILCHTFRTVPAKYGSF
jgi:hypothetical protein